MNYYTYEELKDYTIKQLKLENPFIISNIKNIGLWLKKNGYRKVRKQVGKERRLYYYLPDTENISKKMD